LGRRARCARGPSVSPLSVSRSLTFTQILDHQAKLSAAGETLTKISVTGYSLGGVIARYVLGVLHQRGFFDSVRPVNFNTLATPHIGLPRYDTVLGKLFRTLGPKLLSKTGTQFYATDEWGPRKRPIVEVMADPGTKSSSLDWA
jgi:triacylglycerol esterase/lipase EstA (alpha/beta hydrolase family)